MTSSNTDLESQAPLVSVAMITYNHRPYIEHAINSILNQKTDFGVELIIGEDHSKDGTREFVTALPFRFPGRVRLVTSADNVGMHKNLHRVELASRGKYVAYCEGDDFWHDPYKLAKQVEYLEKRPDYVMVHSHCDRFRVQQRKLLANSLTVPIGLDDCDAYKQILTGVRYPLTVTVMARKNALFDALRHAPECTDPKWPMGDTQRWLELARRGKVGCIHESLATTNILPESAGQSRDSGKRLKFYLAARDLQLHYLQKFPVDAKADRLVRRNLAMSLLSEAFQAGAADKADELFLEFVSQGGEVGLRQRLQRWGSASRFHRALALPILKMESRCSRLRRNLG